MSDTARADGVILIDRRLTLPMIVALAGLVAGAGVGYASMAGRINMLEAATARDGGKVSEINDRTIRIEEQVKFIRQALEQPRR